MITWLNDLRIRGAVAGGLGGFLGWLLSEPIVAPQRQRVPHQRAEHDQGRLAGAAGR